MFQLIRRRERSASLGSVLVVGISTLAGMTTSNAACAQVGYDARTRFAIGHGANPTPIDAPLVINAPGTIYLTLQMGIFNTQGFTNYGVGFWSGSIFASEPLISRPNAPRVAPFNGMFGYDGNINTERTRIGLPGERLVEPTRGDTILHYNEGDPVPGLPLPVGADQFANLYRFSITVGNLTSPRDILLRAEGSNWPLEGFFTVQHIPPDPETGEPGSIWYSPDPAGNGPTPARPTQLSMLTIRVVPGPGSALALTVAAPLLTSRRRR